MRNPKTPPGLVHALLPDAGGLRSPGDIFAPGSDEGPTKSKGVLRWDKSRTNLS
jgi:hypothetical protein